MKKYKDTLLYTIIRPIITMLFKIIYKPIIINEHFIPKNKKIILAGNHTNNLDCLLLMSSTKRHIHFLAKKELFQGLKKIIFNNLGLIPVNRKIKDNSVIPLSKEYLKNDLLIGIFPEGTTEKNTNKLLPFKKGAVTLSYETNTEIIPFKIIGKYTPFKKNIKIIFGNTFLASKDLKKSNDLLYDIINNMKE